MFCHEKIAFVDLQLKISQHQMLANYFLSISYVSESRMSCKNKTSDVSHIEVRSTCCDVRADKQDGAHYARNIFSQDLFFENS